MLGLSGVDELTIIGQLWLTSFMTSLFHPMSPFRQLHASVCCLQELPVFDGVPVDLCLVTRLALICLQSLVIKLKTIPGAVGITTAHIAARVSVTSFGETSECEALKD